MKKNFFRFLVENPWDIAYLFVIIVIATDFIFTDKDYTKGDIVKYILLCVLLVCAIIVHYKSYKKESPSCEQRLMEKKKNFFRFLVENLWNFVYLFVIIGGAADIIFSNKDYTTVDIVKFLTLCALFVCGVIVNYKSYKKESSSCE